MSAKVRTLILLVCIGLGLFILGIGKWKTKPVQEVKPIPTITVVEPVISPSLVDIVPWVKSGVVHIQCPEWQGSGFIVGSNLIMTARHCVEDVVDFRITTDDGHVLHAKRTLSSKNHDIAFIYVDDLTCVAEERGTEKHGVKLTPLELGSIKECQLGQRIFVIGSPYGKINFNAVSLGIISGVERNWDEVGEDYGWSVAFTTDSAGHPGNSGCPVFSMDGKVRGILVGGFSPVLISVMPCDLFMEDLELIVNTFRQDKYAFEGRVTTDELLSRVDELEDILVDRIESLQKKLNELYEWWLSIIEVQEVTTIEE